MCDNAAVELFRFAELMLHKHDFRQAQLKLRHEFIGGQIPFEPIPLGSFRIGNNDRWCPVRSKPFESGPVLLHMNFDGNKILLDESRYTFIRVHVGIQPSAGRSHRGGTKIQKDWLVLLFGLGESRINVFDRFDWHWNHPPTPVYANRGGAALLP